MTDPVFIVIYVDDILLFAMNLDTIVSLKNLFSERFECKDLGPLSRFLGVNVKYEPMSYVMLDQSHYAETFTQKFARQHEMIFSSHREVPLPYDTVERFFFYDETPLLPSSPFYDWWTSFPYMEIIGSILYLALNTRRYIEPRQCPQGRISNIGHAVR
jgi:hypothetical protein